MNDFDRLTIGDITPDLIAKLRKEMPDELARQIVEADKPKKKKKKLSKRALGLNSGEIFVITMEGKNGKRRRKTSKNKIDP